MPRLRRLGFIVALGGSAALMVVAGGCGGGSDTSTGTAGAARPGVTTCHPVAIAGTEDAQFHESPGKFNASFPSGEGRVKVLKVDEAKTIRGEELGSHPRVTYEAPGTFDVITYEVTNLGSDTVEPQRELNERFYVLTQDGEVYGDIASGGNCSSDVATAYAREHGAQSPEEDLPPGETAKSVAVYSVYSLPRQAKKGYWVSVRNGLKTPLEVDSSN
jgi:hypothetical protein